MRHIDRWFGSVICFLLTVLRKIGNLTSISDSAPSKNPRSILIVKLAEQGATVLACKAISKAAEMVGRENVYFLVFRENRFVLDAMNVLPEKNIFTIDTENFSLLAVSASQVLSKIRKLRIDAAVDFEFFARGSAILTYLSGAKTRVGLHSFAGEGPYRGDLMTHRISYNPHIHTSQMFESMVCAIDSPAGELPALNFDTPTVQTFIPAFVPPDTELQEVQNIIQSRTHTGEYRPLVLLNANASDLLPLRRWPSERYVALAKLLIEKSPKVRIAFTGTATEKETVEKLVASVASDRCFSLAGKTTFRQLLVLYCLSDLLVTNDSGPAHFASLTPVKVIVLFGPETPALFGANSSNTSIIRKDIPCSPCVNAYNNRFSACKNNVCMQRISVEEVFQLACKLCNL
jgi:ADP-heptose:LPS heptosyltransferase